MRKAYGMIVLGLLAAGCANDGNSSRPLPPDGNVMDKANPQESPSQPRSDAPMIIRPLGVAS